MQNGLSQIWFNRAKMSKHIHVEHLGVFSYPFPNFNGGSIKPDTNMLEHILLITSHRNNGWVSRPLP